MKGGSTYKHLSIDLKNGAHELSQIDSAISLNAMRSLNDSTILFYRRKSQNRKRVLFIYNLQNRLLREYKFENELFEKHTFSFLNSVNDSTLLFESYVLDDKRWFTVLMLHRITLRDNTLFLEKSKNLFETQSSKTVRSRISSHENTVIFSTLTPADRFYEFSFEVYDSFSFEKLREGKAIIPLDVCEHFFIDYHDNQHIILSFSGFNYFHDNWLPQVQSLELSAYLSTTDSLKLFWPKDKYLHIIGSRFYFSQENKIYRVSNVAKYYYFTTLLGLLQSNEDIIEEYIME